MEKFGIASMDKNSAMVPYQLLRKKYVNGISAPKIIPYLIEKKWGNNTVFKVPAFF
jgi:hypothetical protein